jgi:uncharacterized membrane protein YgcG
MDPSADELAQMRAGGSPLMAACAYAGVGAPVLAALRASLGDFQRARDIAGMPRGALLAGIETASLARVIANEELGVEAVEPRQLNALEQGQAGVLARIARLLVGLRASELEEVAPVAAAGVVAVATPLGVRRVKLANTVDQGDETEVAALTSVELRGLAKRYKMGNDGLAPMDVEEATADQIIGIKSKLDADVVPYADFGILRPFGHRLGRALRFHAKVWCPETLTYVAKELPGPSDFTEWRRSWRVFVNIMRTLEAASSSRLERYYEHIHALNDKYGNLGGVSTWWLIALADQRMRSERMEKIRRKIDAEADELSARGVVQGASAKPWDIVFLEAAEDHQFWYAEVAEKAMLYVNHIKGAPSLLDEGHHVWQAGGVVAAPKAKALSAGAKARAAKQAARAAGGGKGGGGGGAGNGDGKGGGGKYGGGPKGGGHYDDGKGKKGPKGKGGKAGKGKGKQHEDCYIYNRDVGGCSEPCPNGRRHQCEYCGGAHPGTQCGDGVG